MPKNAYRFTGRMPSIYPFLAGSVAHVGLRLRKPMVFEHDKYPDEIDFYACSLENPGRSSCRSSTCIAPAAAMVKLADGLPQYGEQALQRRADWLAPPR